jgi:hypothetical protein
VLLTQLTIGIGVASVEEQEAISSWLAMRALRSSDTTVKLSPPEAQMHGL